MLYVQQSLAPDEDLIHIGSFHWFYTVSAVMSIVWGFFLAVMVMFVAYHGYKVAGRMPADVGFLQSFMILHPAIRVVSFLMFVFGLIKFAQMMIRKVTTEIAVTTHRIVLKVGLVARATSEIKIDRVEGVNVLQTTLGRIFNFGRVMVRGMGVGEVVLPQIQDPISFRRAIEEARSR